VKRSTGFLEMGTARVEAFSDAVMAVIITIMAFGLRPPRAATLDAVRDQLPGLLVYILSFAFIAIYWNNHHHLLRRTERVSAAVMWANLHLLFWLSLVPILTEWVATSYRATEPAACYGVAALAAAVGYTVLVRAIITANGGVEGAVAQSIGSDVKGRASLGLYALGVVLSFVTPYLAYGCYAAVALMWFVPDRRLAT
jgi:uncharacterized membrane protein